MPSRVLYRGIALMKNFKYVWLRIPPAVCNERNFNLTKGWEGKNSANYNHSPCEWKSDTSDWNLSQCDYKWGLHHYWKSGCGGRR